MCAGAGETFALRRPVGVAAGGVRCRPAGHRSALRADSPGSRSGRRRAAQLAESLPAGRGQTLCSDKCRGSMKRTRGSTLRSRAALRRPDRLPGDALHAGLHRTPPAATMDRVPPAENTHSPRTLVPLVGWGEHREPHRSRLVGWGERREPQRSRVAQRGGVRLRLTTTLRIQLQPP